jgi:hypothetical protein
MFMHIYMLISSNIRVWIEYYRNIKIKHISVIDETIVTKFPGQPGQNSQVNRVMRIEGPGSGCLKMKG